MNELKLALLAVKIVHELVLAGNEWAIATLNKEGMTVADLEAIQNKFKSTPDLAEE